MLEQSSFEQLLTAGAELIIGFFRKRKVEQLKDLYRREGDFVATFVFNNALKWNGNFDCF